VRAPRLPAAAVIASISAIHADSLPKCSSPGVMNEICACWSPLRWRNCAAYIASPSRTIYTCDPKSLRGTTEFNRALPRGVIMPLVKTISESKLTPCGIRRRTIGKSIGRNERASSAINTHHHQRQPIISRAYAIVPLYRFCRVLAMGIPRAKQSEIGYNTCATRI
jgi:hypothetical protein